MKVILKNSNLVFQKKGAEKKDAVIGNIRDLTDRTRACFTFYKTHNYNTVSFDNDKYEANLAYNTADGTTIGRDTWNILDSTGWRPSPIDVSQLHGDIDKFGYAVVLRHKGENTKEFTEDEVKGIVSVE